MVSVRDWNYIVPRLFRAFLAVDNAMRVRTRTTTGEKQEREQAGEKCVTHGVQRD